MTVPSLSRMVTLFLENVAVQSCAHSGAIAVRDVDKSASRKTWASIRGPAGAIANFVDAMDWMTEPLGSATCNPLEARIGRFGGTSLIRMSVSVAPVSASVVIFCCCTRVLIGCYDTIGFGFGGVGAIFLVIEQSLLVETLIDELQGNALVPKSPTYQTWPPATSLGERELIIAGVNLEELAAIYLHSLPLWPMVPWW